MIPYFDEIYDEILWWIFMIWIYVMMDDDEMMWFYFVLILWSNDTKYCENKLW